MAKKWIDYRHSLCLYLKPYRNSDETEICCFKQAEKITEEKAGFSESDVLDLGLNNFDYSYVMRGKIMRSK
jgi:hypothetical protein